MLDPQSLEALEALVDCGSVGAAASRLNKTPSAVSYHLRRLEEQAGIAVFNRQGYRLSLTLEGDRLLAEARPLLRRWRELSNRSNWQRESWETSLNVVYDGVLPTDALLAVLRTLQQEGSGTRFELNVAFLDGVQKEFEERQADVLISTVPVDGKSLLLRPLLPLNFTLCCSGTHALASLKQVTLDRLRGEIELVVPGLSGDDALQARQFHSDRVYRLGDFHCKLSAIVQGVGYGWLPDYLAQPLLDRGILVPVRFDAFYRFSLVPLFATRQGRLPGRACQLLLSSLVKHNWLPRDITEAHATIITG